MEALQSLPGPAQTATRPKRGLLRIVRVILIPFLILPLTMCASLERYSALPGGPRAHPNSRGATDAPGAADNPLPADSKDAGPARDSLAQGGAKVLYGSDGAGTSYAVDLAGLNSKREAVIRSAMSLLGRDELKVNGRTFNLDCTGVILAAYWGAGYDLMPYFNREEGNGVRRLHDTAKNRGKLFTRTLPEPGDIIFWDDTYDMNEDGRWGDLYTHNGIVVAVEPNGQVTYIHHNYSLGIVMARMNLSQVEVYRDSAGKELNSPMRMRKDRHIRPDQWLSSHLFRTYGDLVTLF